MSFAAERVQIAHHGFHPLGLRNFEDTQLEYGRDLVGYGVALGQRWASKHERKPQP